MLSVRQRELAAAMEETGRIGAGTVRGALAPEARHGLVAALESAAIDSGRGGGRIGGARLAFHLKGLDRQRWQGSQASEPKTESQKRRHRGSIRVTRRAALALSCNGTQSRVAEFLTGSGRWAIEAVNLAPASRASLSARTES